MHRIHVAPVELDLATCPLFLARLKRKIDRTTEVQVYLDCAEIRFMDTSAYHALVDATFYAVDCGHTLVIGGVRPVPAQLLAACDTGGYLTVEPLDELRLKRAERRMWMRRFG